jgi:hypothetical protein
MENGGKRYGNKGGWGIFDGTGTISWFVDNQILGGCPTWKRIQLHRSHHVKRGLRAGDGFL